MSNFQSYSTYVPEDHQEVYSSGPNIREESPVYRTTTTNGAMSQSSEQAVDRGRESQLNPAYGTESWQATAITKTGRSVSTITGDTLVTLAGVQGSVDFFVSEGLLQQGPDGKYTEGSGPAPAAQTVDPGHSPIDEGAMSVVNAALDPLPQQSLNVIEAYATSVALGRLEDSSLVAKFSQASGLDPAASADRLGAVKAIYQDHADKATGLDATDHAEFWAWAKANHPGQLQEAIGKQLNGHNVSGYKALADRWMASTAPSLAALSRAGIQTRNPSSGPECFIAGRWMSPESAARAGLI